MLLSKRFDEWGHHEPILNYIRSMSYNKTVICPLRLWLKESCHVDYSTSKVVIA